MPVCSTAMRKTFGALAVASFVLIGAGCHRGPSLVGKWDADQGMSNVEFEFKPDNTYAMTSKVGQMTITAGGDYKLDGDKLTVTTKSFDAPGLPPALLAQAKKSPDFGKPRDMTLKFASDDQIDLSGIQMGAVAAGPQSVSLKRVK